MKRKFIKTSFIIPILVVLLVVVAMVQFFWGVSEDTEKTAFVTLEEAALQHVELFSIKLEDQFNILEALAEHIGTHLDLNKDKDTIISELKSTATFAEFRMVGVVYNTNGDVYTSTGKETNIVVNGKPRDYMAQAFLGNNYIDIIRDSTLLKDECVIQSVPIFNKNREIIGVLYGSYTIDVFTKILTPSIFGGQAFAVLTEYDGRFITRTENPGFLHVTDNIFDLYSYASISNNMTVDKIKANILDNNRGSFSYKINGDQRCTFYTPSGYNDWYIFISVPQKVISQVNSFIVTRVVTLVTELLFIGSIIAIAVILSENNKRKALLEENEQIRQTEEVYRLVNDMSDTIMFVCDPKNDTITFNNKFNKIFMRTPITKISDMPRKLNNVYEYDLSAYIKFGKDMIECKPSSSVEYRVRTYDNKFKWYHSEFITLYDYKDEPYKIVGKMVCVENERRELQKLKEKANTDSLTKLLTHGAVKSEINTFLTNEGKDSIHALFYIDIDNFKKINDTYGHSEGDNILIKYAEEMLKLFRETDIIGRLGGDEFVILVKDMHFMAMVETKAQRLCDAIASFKYATQDETFSSCSIGIAMYNKDGVTFEELYKCADKALYQAKKNGKNKFVIFDNSISEIETDKNHIND